MSAPPTHVWVDGEVMPAGDRHLSVYDRGFQLGDGIFETLRARAGRPTELAEHLTRLRASAAGLELPLPDDIETRLTEGIAALLSAEGLDGPEGDASIRITVSRGPFRSRGVLPAGEPVPATFVIQAWPVAAAPSDAPPDPIHLVTSAVRRDPRNPLLALKTTSRAEYVYAKLEARRAGGDDALFLTVDDDLSEATSANIFLVRDEPDGSGAALATPSLDCGILSGTTRAWVLAWGERVGLRPLEARLTRNDLAGADEAFLCSSVAGIVPVTRFDGSPIGAGIPGPWTLRARADRESMIRAVEAS